MLLAPSQTGRGKCILGNLNWWGLNGCRTGKEISLSSFPCPFFLPLPPLLSLRQCLMAQDSLDPPELLMQPRLVSNPIFLFQPPNCCDMDHRIGLWKSLERMFIPVASRSMRPAPVFYKVWILCHSFCYISCILPLSIPFFFLACFQVHQNQFYCQETMCHDNLCAKPLMWLIPWSKRQEGLGRLEIG